MRQAHAAVVNCTFKKGGFLPKKEKLHIFHFPFKKLQYTRFVNTINTIVLDEDRQGLKQKLQQDATQKEWQKGHTHTLCVCVYVCICVSFNGRV